MDENYDNSKAFACIVTKKGVVFWQKGEDYTSGLDYMFRVKTNTFPERAKVQIVPKYGNYCNLDNTKIIIDNGVVPVWWKNFHEQKVYEAFNEWKTWLYSIMDVSKLPQNPYSIIAPTIEQRHIDLLKECNETDDRVSLVMIESIEKKIGPSVWSYLFDLCLKRYYVDSIFGLAQQVKSIGIGPNIIYIQVGYMFSLPFWGKENSTEYPYISFIKLMQEGLVPGGNCLYGSPTGNEIAHRLWSSNGMCLGPLI